MLEVNNFTNFSIDKDTLFAVVEKALRGERRKVNISLAFVKEEEIKKINKIYRKKNHSTDVLAFAYSKKSLIGEIILCPAKIKKNAEENNTVFEEELLRVFVHGVLHLLGYSHNRKEKEKEMNEKTRTILRDLKIIC